MCAGADQQHTQDQGNAWLCKFIVAASFLLVAVASLCLWWTGQAYEYAALAFFPFAVPMLLLIMVCDLLAALNGRRR
ncbi:hypothetical protein [Pseudomonas aeruginosa]|uniref:hypothetical protein n=1 Tax=Pseudomonas aeruginosa TaxID=287 RepID=UPI00105111A8|nr:hypothetical protein [Pseudomonas aeruginosa]